MQSILDNVEKTRHRIAPQNVIEFIALQMAMKAGDPFLFRPYLRTIEATSLGHCLEIFRSDRRLPISK